MQAVGKTKNSYKLIHDTLAYSTYTQTYKMPASVNHATSVL